jgi:hypothetical protein
MTKNLLLEPFADGVRIDEVDFMQHRHIILFRHGVRRFVQGEKVVDPDTAMSMSAWAVAVPFGHEPNP